MKKNIVPGIAEKILNEIGLTQEAIAKICGVKQPAVAQWIKRGMPLSWCKYLKKEFPTLEIWSSIEGL